MEIIKGVINIEQLPVVKQRFSEISEKAKEDVSRALSLPATDENRQTLKAMRAALRKDFEMYEGARKAVNREIEERLKPFNEAYAEYISGVYKPADAELKAKIDSIENTLKAEKAEEAKAYFDEYAKTLGIDFVGFEDSGVNVTLSASMKSLKEGAKAFADRINGDLKLIATQEHKEEILIEYKKSLNVSEAITAVSDRHKAIEAISKNAEADTAEEDKPTDTEADEPLSPPAVEEPKYKCSFTCFATVNKLKKLKNFMKEEEIDYE